MQRIHERAILRSGVPESENVVDGAPVPDVREGAYTAYVDNFLAFDINHERARAKVAAVMSGLTRMGLEVEHDDPYANGADAEVLGWRIRRRPTAVCPKPERLWKARLAVRGALARGR